MATPNYHPLQVWEIEKLLEEAKEAYNNGDGSSVSRIQGRLIGGIRGMEEPRQNEGPVAVKLSKVEKKYMDFVADKNFKLVDIYELAREFRSIMES
jgi:hypothetical protein